ncbi:MAG TPA: DUF1573 domain-containing protein [Saprospiraceae bacterium]|nr:DUF1573 domain-containing protein [Saprospiraceae bacterium]
MTQILRISLLIISALSAPALLVAQPDQPPADIRPQVRKLTAEQKLKVLEYMRTLGAQLDKEVQQVYEQVSPDNRQKAQQYIQLLQQPTDKMGSTTVRWNRDTSHFGLLEEGRIWIDSFRVTNTGREPYLIKEVKSSCDCTVLRYPNFPVMPGETATLRVEFDSRGKYGRAIPGIIVYDNSSPNARNLLYLKGEVMPRKKPKDPLEGLRKHDKG